MLVLLSLCDGAHNLKEIRDQAYKAGWKIPSAFNMSNIFAGSKGLVIKTHEGWEITKPGLEYLANLGAPLLETNSAAGAACLNKHVGIHPEIQKKCDILYASKSYAEAVEKSFKVVRDRLRALTGHETGSEAFGKTNLHIGGATAPHVDKDFNEGVKFLTMAIDKFRNEKSHTSDANISDPIRAQQYLMLSSLAMYLLDNAEV